MANEIRLRSNNISGTITDNPLTNVATVINSPGFVDLPVVNATNHLILILDPLEINGPAEIVTVTAHTAAASSVTVVRGAEGSAARSHLMTTTWFHGPVVTDYAPVPVPAVRVYRSANQSINDASETLVAWDLERFDTTNSMHDNAVNNTRLVAPTAGVYLMTFHGWLEQLTTFSAVYTYFRVNGTLNIAYDSRTPTAFNFAPFLSNSMTWKMAAGDFVEVLVYQDNTANVARNLQGGDVTVTAGATEFSLTYLAAG